MFGELDYKIKDNSWFVQVEIACIFVGKTKSELYPLFCSRKSLHFFFLFLLFTTLSSDFAALFLKYSEHLKCCYASHMTLSLLCLGVESQGYGRSIENTVSIGTNKFCAIYFKTFVGCAFVDSHFVFFKKCFDFVWHCMPVVANGSLFVEFVDGFVQLSTSHSRGGYHLVVVVFLFHSASY